MTVLSDCWSLNLFGLWSPGPSQSFNNPRQDYLCSETWLGCKSYKFSALFSPLENAARLSSLFKLSSNKINVIPTSKSYWKWTIFALISSTEILMVPLGHRVLQEYTSTYKYLLRVTFKGNEDANCSWFSEFYVCFHIVWSHALY